ncbi:MAG: DinB family protein, partial [Candidatus Dormibacterales bacterium]
MLDFGPVRRNQTTLQEMAGGLTAGDLAALTDEMCEVQLRLMAGIEDEDAVFVPDDPEADDTFAATPGEVQLPWTLGHVITHTTASSEEQAALALT